VRLGGEEREGEGEGEVREYVWAVRGRVEVRGHPWRPLAEATAAGNASMATGVERNDYSSDGVLIYTSRRRTILDRLFADRLGRASALAHYRSQRSV
jgi:hypothetical protein